MNTHQSQSIQNKRDSIKVCIRVRPLLFHEDTEYWYIDSNSGIISSNDHQVSSTPMSRVLMDSTYSKQKFQFDNMNKT